MAPKPFMRWANLPPDPLRLILNRLSFIDHARFGAVCRSWRSAGIDHPRHQFLHNPCLLLPENQQTGLSSSILFSPFQNRAFRLTVLINPETRCIGSSHGWLIMCDASRSSYFVLNLFMAELIELPDPSTINFVKSPVRATFFKKAILSSGATRDPCWVAAIAGEESNSLIFCCLGDESWSTFPLDYCKDLIFRDGFLFVLDKELIVRVCALEPAPQIIRSYAAPTPSLLRNHPLASRICQTVTMRYYKTKRRFWSSREFYLVESAGNLLMVVRYLHLVHPTNGELAQGYYVANTTVGFQVFMEVENKWVKVENLDNVSLIVGSGQSKSFAVEEGSAFMRNYIYFAGGCCVDSAKPIIHDWGMFSLNHQAVVPFYPSPPMKSVECPTLWLTLNDN